MSEKKPSNAAKRLARLMAVQALYQASYEQDKLVDILRRAREETATLLNDGAEEEGDTPIKQSPDPDLLSDIVNGVTAHREALEAMVAGALDARLSAQRMEILLRLILLCGAYELHHSPAVPQGVVISDYVDVARAFFAAKEPGLVNAVLDKLAQKLRS